MDLIEKTSNENRHPWELSRAQCILNIVKKHNLSSAADIGAGDHFFASKLLSFIPGPIYAVDAGYNEKSEVIDNIHCLNDISDLPNLNDKCGAMLMDVIEHIEDETVFLKKILEKIPVGGLVFITVPAFQFLFSEHDIFLKHYRRYNKKQLLTLIRSQNLCIEKSHYFYSSLFFARIAGLLLKKIKTAKPTGIGGWNFSEKHIITRFIYAILNIDFRICAFLALFRIYLPGLSLLAVCRKIEDSPQNKMER
ncbi:MAG: class I SAM-dependent methyltransferase [Fibromonadales bacterium]|nr:class I SAM-dependent methyltransferase [Fibromonadales bacterium]